MLFEHLKAYLHGGVLYEKTPTLFASPLARLGRRHQRPLGRSNYAGAARDSLTAESNPFSRMSTAKFTVVMASAVYIDFTGTTFGALFTGNKTQTVSYATIYPTLREF